MNQKRVYIIGGGTFSHVRTHMSVCSMAFGKTAKQLFEMCRKSLDKMSTVAMLTAMACEGHSSIQANDLRVLAEWPEFTGDAKKVTTKNIITNDDVAEYMSFINRDLKAKIVFMTAAMCDFHGTIIYNDAGETIRTPSGKHLTRLSSAKEHVMILTPAAKVISLLRNGGIYICQDGREIEFQPRKDIFLVGFKTTSGHTEDGQYRAALDLCKSASCNLVLANDVVTRLNMIVTPEEARYHVTKNRHEVLTNLIDMAHLRSHLTFTRSTVVAGDPIPWNSPLIPESLRTVVNYCINNAAYKPFKGATVGHFACKIGPKTFLTSRRKTDFNRLADIGLVKIETDGPDSVLAYGSKPSVGGQSQRIVFDQHPQYDCIVHFHCPIKPDSKVSFVSQREYECGSHECGENTSQNLSRFTRMADGSWLEDCSDPFEPKDTLSAVYLDQHGPNIVFNHAINPLFVIDFIERNFDLSQKTGGPV